MAFFCGMHMCFVCFCMTKYELENESASLNHNMNLQDIYLSFVYVERRF